LQNVFPFEIGILKQEFINAASGSDLSDDHAHGNANPANASLAAHHFWALCDAIQRFHAGSPGLAIPQYYSKGADALNEPLASPRPTGRRTGDGDNGDYILWLIDGLFGNLIRAAIVLESASVVDFLA
jgi:hypothetical protein